MQNQESGTVEFYCRLAAFASCKHSVGTKQVSVPFSSKTKNVSEIRLCHATLGNLYLYIVIINSIKQKMVMRNCRITINCLLNYYFIVLIVIAKIKSAKLRCAQADYNPFLRKQKLRNCQLIYPFPTSTT